MESCSNRRVVIVALDGQVARIRFINESACASCHAKSACGASDTKQIEVEVSLPPDHAYHVGDPIAVSVRNRQGYLALYLGYGIPFLILVLALIALSLLGCSEAQIALSLVSILVFYYVLLFVFRRRLSRRFSFTISSEQKSE